MSNNNFNEREISTVTPGGECSCGASGGIMDGGCICGFDGGNDEIDGGAEFDLNVGYFGGDVDNLSDGEFSGSSSDTS